MQCHRLLQSIVHAKPTHFSTRIPEVREENYWKRLQILKMYSQERGMERYRIIYIWKILENYAPNCDIELANQNKRLGMKCKIPNINHNGRKAIQTFERKQFPDKRS